MTEITPTIEADYPKAFAKAERERPWITQGKNAGEHRVVPRKLKDGSREHGKYLVRTLQFGERLFADCVNMIDGKDCEGYHYTGFCYHIAGKIKHCQRQESRAA